VLLDKEPDKTNLHFPLDMYAAIQKRGTVVNDEQEF